MNTATGSKTNPKFQDFKVLVVDDSRTLRRILIQELNSLGIHQIIQAGDGLEAMQKLNSEEVDLVLLDLEMPDLDGLGVLELMKKDPKLQSLSVLIISGAEDITSTIKCIELGAEDYLPKPFNPVLLKARISSCYEKKRVRLLEQLRLEEVTREKQLLEAEQMKTEKLMLNILPRPIAERLKRGEKNIAGSYPDVTILFSDLVGFTSMASVTSATDLVRLLNDLFTRFDKRADAIGLEKIKTIGDAYMAVGGLPIPRGDHANLCAEMALGMFDDLRAFNKENGKELNMRIGIDSGPVVAGVIGFTKFSYDLWGNAVNMASRMESTSQPGKIQVSKGTYETLQESYFFKEAGEVMVKGIGMMPTHFLMSRR